MTRRLVCWACWAMLLCAASLGRGSASAAEPKKALKYGEYNPEHETVELFDAIEQGQVDVRVIHKDSSSGKALITNKSGKPLNVKLPEAFAGVHVLAQIGGGQGVGVGGGLGQATGGGMGGGGGGMGGGGMGGGGGMFNIPPEKVGEVPFNSVCLEHGKPEPKPGMRYEIRPIETVTTRKEVAELVKLLNRGVVSQRVAQILAWHWNNDMSLEQLAAKEIRHLDGTTEPYFQLDEIRAAMALKEHVNKLVADRAKTPEIALPKL